MKTLIVALVIVFSQPVFAVPRYKHPRDILPHGSGAHGRRPTPLPFIPSPR